jgi:hypothetical protein
VTIADRLAIAVAKSLPWLTSAKAIVVVLWAQPLKSADILKQHEVGKIELKRMGLGALFEKAWVRFAKEQSKIVIVQNSINACAVYNAAKDPWSRN